MKKEKMKNIVSFLIIILILSVSCKKDEAPEKEKSFQTEYLYNLNAMTITTSGGLLAKGKKWGGSIVLLKFDENCEFVWKKTDYSWGDENCDPAGYPCGGITLEKAFSAESDDIILLCNKGDAWGVIENSILISIDKNGNENWHELIHSGYSQLSFFTKTEDGFVGYDFYDNILISYNSNGVKLNESYLTELTELSVDKISHDKLTNNIIFLTTTDTLLGFEKLEYTISGNLVNRNVYIINDYTLRIKYNPNSVFLMQDGGMIFLGYTYDDNNILIRINESSDTLWTKKLAENEKFSYNELQFITENKFLVKGPQIILYMNTNSEILSSKEIDDGNYFFQNNDFVFQTFLDDDYDYWITKTTFNEFFSK